MNAIDIEKLNQLISRTDISGNDKIKWLTDFIDGRELQQDETGEYSFGSFLNFNYDAYKQNLRHQEELAKVVANLVNIPVKIKQARGMQLQAGI